MNREFLESLELEKDAIDSIMKEHGKTVQATKTELEDAQTTAQTLQEQLDERNEDIKKLHEESGSNEELATKLKDWETKYSKDTEELENRLAEQRKQSAIQLGVTKAGAKNEKAVMALLDAEAIQINDDGVHGLKEQIEALQESDTYLFEPANDPSGQASVGGNTGGGKKPPKNNAFTDAVTKYTK